MSVQVNFPSQNIVTTGTTLRLKMLPLNSRTLPTLTITTATAGTDVSVTTSAIVNKGATTVTVASLSAAIPNKAKILFANGVTVRLSAAAASGATTLSIEAAPDAIPSGATGTFKAGTLAQGTMYLSVAALPADLDVGEILTFGAVTVTVTDFAPIGSTVVDILPLPSLLTAGATATTLALLQLVGVVDCTPNSAPKTVDITNYTSGVGNEMVVTAVSKTMNMTFNRIVGDRGGIEIMKLLYDNSFYNREIYAQLIRPFDGTYEGAAIVTQGDQQSGIQDLVKQTANLQFQGVSFKYTPAAV